VTSPRRVNGYEDGELLRIARQANVEMRGLLDESAEAIARLPGMAGLAFRISLKLQQQHSALLEMERIRSAARRKTQSQE
jgi:hypothetical protein